MIGTNDLGAARCLGEEKAILDAAPGTAERFVVHFFCVYAHSPAPACDQHQTHQQLHQEICNAIEDWQGLWVILRAADTIYKPCQICTSTCLVLSKSTVLTDW